MSDRISLRGLRVMGRHGWLAHEAEVAQLFVVDLDLVLDLAPAGRSDELADTIDYGALARAVADQVSTSGRRLLEAVAEDLAGLALADRRVRQVRVRVAKPQAPMQVDGEVAVEVVREQPS